MPSIQSLMQCATGLLAMSPFSEKGLNSEPNLDVDQTVLSSTRPRRYKYVEINKRSIAAVSSGAGINIFGIGDANAVYTKHSDALSDENSWTSIGGNSSSPPAVVSDEPGSLAVFIRGQDNAIWKQHYNGSDWSGFESLGGDFVLTPTAVSWGSGHVEVFGIGTNRRVYHKTYNRGSGWTTDWEDLGGTGTSEIAAVSWGPGRIDIVVVSETYTTYTMAFSDGSWARGWQQLGGPFGSPRFRSPPTVVSWGPGRLDVFVVGRDGNQDGALMHTYFDKGYWNGGYWNRGGNLTSAVSAVASSVDDTRRIDIFALGGADADTDKYSHVSSDGKKFTSWVKHGGAFNSEPAVVSGGSDRLDVFGIGASDNAIWHQALDGSEWTPSITGWESAGGKFKNFA